MTERQVRWPWPLLSALLVAYAALLGSLYFSEIRHFTPCLLCWYQRILMYPLVPLLAYTLISRVPRLAYLVLSLAVVGQGVSTYHYLLQKTTWLTAATACEATGVSCAITYIDWFGVITIPMLAMLAFMLISLSTVLYLNGMGGDGPISLTLDTQMVGVVAVLLGLGVAAWLVVRTATATGVPVEMPVPLDPTLAAAEVPQDASAIVRQGARLFADNCAVCHGPEGVGIPNLTPSLQTSTTVREATPAELEALVRAGIAADDPRNQLGNMMPPLGGADLSDRALQAIITYLKAHSTQESE